MAIKQSPSETAKQRTRNYTANRTLYMKVTTDLDELAHSRFDAALVGALMATSTHEEFRDLCHQISKEWL